MNLRESLNFNDSYFTINREERNLAAIFYHILILKGNLERFLDKIDYPLLEEKDMEIYFEYAYARDLWNNLNNTVKDLDERNRLKKKFIIDYLQPKNREELENKDPFEFNEYFGASRALSKDHISSPANWSITSFSKRFPDNTSFLKVCKFKWCFNAKPDIVIHTTKNTTICIEAKYESGEGKYPASKAEKDIFTERGLESVGQLSIQKELMESVLGMPTDFIFLVKNKRKASENDDLVKTWTWVEIFECLDTSTSPYFIQEWLKRLKDDEPKR